MLLQYRAEEWVQNTPDVYGGGGMKKDEGSIWKCKLNSRKLELLERSYIRLNQLNSFSY